MLPNRGKQRRTLRIDLGCFGRLPPTRFLIGRKLRRSVRPWSRTQPFASRQKLPLRHPLDYTIHYPELRSVVFTAAPKDDSYLLVVDATACTNGCSEMLSVLSPLNLAVVQFPTAGDLTAARKS